MKNILYSVVGVAILTFAACEPITDTYSEGQVVASASELKATAEAVVVNGKNSNKVYVHCTSPVLCQWTDGVNTLSATEGYLTLLLTGEQTITLTATAANGSKFTKEFTVTIDELTEPVDPAYGYFCGDGAKKWTWIHGTRCWCNGDGNGIDCEACWWGVEDDEIADQMDGKGLPNEGFGATMEFVLSGKKMIKTDADGNVTTGKFEFDMTPQKTDNWDGVVDNWAIGKLSFINTNILFPNDVNHDLDVWTEYGIIELTDDRLVLAARTHTVPYDASAGEHWTWIFVPVAE
ncbi:hypothetical protein AGMMS4956_08820 [Bacteroidia bacterium]|nr:hypothetical protein AGMMS4956_08820 [Bacteroidia bacterium]